MPFQVDPAIVVGPSFRDFASLVVPSFLVVTLAFLAPFLVVALAFHLHLLSCLRMGPFQVAAFPFSPEASFPATAFHNSSSPATMSYLLPSFLVAGTQVDMLAALSLEDTVVASPLDGP